MNKKIAWLSIIGGAISSILGILGGICLTPVCGVVCIGGIFSIIAGAGMAVLLHKYHLIFLLIGLCIFITGIILLIKCKKECSCVRK